MIPEQTRRHLRWGAALLVTVAAIANITHTRTHAEHHGQTGLMPWVIALLPDILIILSVWRLRYDRRSAWGWIGVTLAGGFVTWSSIATAPQYPTAMVIAGFAVAVAVVATGLAHDPSGETREEFIARHEEAVREALTAAERATVDADGRVAEAAAQARLEADAARAVAEAKVTELEAKVIDITARMSERAAPVTLPPAPVKRQPARVNPQVTPDVPDGLSDAETDVLTVMLGRGEITRSDIIKDSRRLETTVKAALRSLIEKGYVVSERRGIYRTTTPGIEGQWLSDGDGRKGSLEGSDVTGQVTR